MKYFILFLITSSTFLVHGHKWGSPINLTEFEESVLAAGFATNDLNENCILVIREGQIQTELAALINLQRFERLAKLKGRISDAKIAINNDGSVLAAWTERSQNRIAVKVAVKLKKRWSHEVVVSSDRNVLVSQISIATVDSNRAFVIWSEYDGERQRVKVSQYLLGSWSSPISLDEEREHSEFPAIAVNSLGEATAAWVSQLPGSTRIRGASYNGLKWTEPKTLSSPKLPNASQVRVAIDELGNAVAIWQQYNGANNRIDCAFNTFGEWSSPIILSSRGVDAANPYVTLTLTGEACAIWQEFDGAYSLKYGYQLPSKRWAIQTILENIESFKQYRASLNSLGDALILITPHGQAPIKSGYFAGKHWNEINSLKEGGLVPFDPIPCIDNVGQFSLAWTTLSGPLALVQLLKSE